MGKITQLAPIVAAVLADTPVTKRVKYKTPKYFTPKQWAHRRRKMKLAKQSRKRNRH